MAETMIIRFHEMGEPDVLKYNVSSGDTVLVIPASGGVGMAAIQTIKKAGGISIGVTRSREKADMIRAFGADHVIVTNEEELVTRVRELNSKSG